MQICLAQLVEELKEFVQEENPRVALLTNALVKTTQPNLVQVR